jgi:hypothetical protein
MATGSLNYPFATDRWCEVDEKFSPRACDSLSHFPDPGKTQAIGELAVDRASVNRLLLENPESLAPVLEALMSALSERPPLQITSPYNSCRHNPKIAKEVSS